MATGTITVVLGNSFDATTKTVTLPVTRNTAGPFTAWLPGAGKIRVGHEVQGGFTSSAPWAAKYLGWNPALGSLTGPRRTGYPSAYHTYLTPQQATVAGANAALTGDIDAMQAKGISLLCSIKGAGTFDQTAAGNDDAFFDTMIEGLITRGHPAILDFHEEPVNDNIGGPSNYEGALAHLISRVNAAGGQNLIAVTGALGVGAFPPFGSAVAADWINAVVNAGVLILNTHGYNHGANDKAASTWKTVDQVYGTFWGVADGIIPASMPKMLGEFNVRDRSTDTTYGPTWLDQHYSYCLVNNCQAIFPFNSNANIEDDPANQGWSWDYYSAVSSPLQPSLATRGPKFAQIMGYSTSV